MFQAKRLVKLQTDKRRITRLPQPKLDQSGALPDEFRRLMRRMPVIYRDRESRNRLLAGVQAGENVGLDRTDMLVLIWTLKCVNIWTNSKSGQAAEWKAARNLTKAARKRGDAREAKLLRQSTSLLTAAWAGTLAAYAALGFARKSGFNNHALALWRSFEPALLSEVYSMTSQRELRLALQFPRDAATNPVFAQSERIRQRLIYLRGEKRQNIARVNEEADRIFALLSRSAFQPGLLRRGDHPASWI
jgi:hypothetical protein